MSADLCPEPLVILGMFRSGTSCVASCFSKLGYYLGGEEELFPAGPANEGGYFEIKELVQLNRNIQTVFDMRYFHIADIPAHWQELPASESLVQELGRLLTRKFQNKQRWGWKEPQTAVLLPIYREAMRRLELRPLYVICVRNPVDAAASHIKHVAAPFSEEEAVGLWLHYTLSALRETRGQNRMVIPYESFLDQPGSYLEQASQYSMRDPVSASAIDEGANLATRDRRHQRADPSELSRWPQIVADTYGLALECADGPAEFRKGAFDERIETLWLAWRQVRSMVKTSSRPSGRFIFADTAGSAASVEVPFSPSPTWQTLNAKLTYKPGASVRIDPYQTPCIVWFRRAVVRGEGHETSATLRAGRSGQLTKIGEYLKLVVWGPEPMVIVLPRQVQIESIELEFLVLTDSNAMNEVMAALRNI